MSLYRFILLGPRGETIADVEAPFNDDAAAQEHAQRFLFDWPYEVRQGARVVAAAAASRARPARDLGNLTGSFKDESARPLERQS